jgi:hypothetical protein
MYQMTKFELWLQQEKIEREFNIIQKQLDLTFQLVEHLSKEYKESTDGARRKTLMELRESMLEEAHRLIHKQDKLYHSLPK